MLQLQDITLKRGSKELFEQMQLVVHDGHKLGLVGRNGIGKSTIFELIRQRLLPEDGNVLVPKAWTIAHLEQEVAPSARSALDWVLDGDQPLRTVQRKIAKAEATDQHAELGMLYDEYANVDGYTAEARAGEILHGLGFTGADFERQVNAFSGGWRIRLNLAQTLMTRSDLLLLDEPTNHLDLDATLWLERWLLRYPGTLLLISHDRDFLDRVVGEIAHIQHQRIAQYRGNYTEFERQRTEQLAQQQSIFEKQERRRKEIVDFVNRFKAKASKARQAQSRMKELHRLTASAPAHADAPYRFTFPNPKKISNPLVAMEEASVGYDHTPVLSDLNRTIAPGARIGLLGRNGAGKTTLVRAIAGELKLLSGTSHRGEHASIGYFTQHTLETLVPGDSPIRHLERRHLEGRHADKLPRTGSQPAAVPATDQERRNFLGGWGFSGDMAMDPVATLSGGEKARLSLAMIAWQRPGILLLDEPTNHLDLDMRHALAVALQAYDGAIIIVSHDRSLLRACVDEYWLVHNGRVRDYDGTLDDYAEWLLGRGELSSPEQDESPPLGAKARRAQQAQARQATQGLRNDIKRFEKDLAARQSKLDKINERLQDQTLYGADRKPELTRLLREQGELRTAVDGIEAKWLHAMEALEAAEGQ